MGSKKSRGKGKAALGHGGASRQPVAGPKGSGRGEGEAGLPPKRSVNGRTIGIPSFGQLLRSKLLLAGLLFFALNSTYSYMFYQVNSFKIALVLAGVSIIAVWNDLLFPEYTEGGVPWKQLLILSVPLLATLPGFLWHHGDYNYNFRYELASYLVVIVWGLYLYRGVRKEEDLKPFLFFIGITVAYVCCWAVLERLGYDPLHWGGVPDVRVKSTFGNTNYFAGFLVVLIPLLLACCLPGKVSEQLSSDRPSGKRENPLSGRMNLFYTVVLVLAGVSLILTETRAAQVAVLVSLGVFVLLYASIFTTPQTQKKVFYVALAGSLLTVVAVILLFAFAGHLPQNRYTQLFTIGGWAPRFAGWIPAIKSIEASPWIGYGLGSSYNLFFAFVDPNSRLYSPEHSYNHVHSEFLEYSQEGGLIGLAVLLLFWGYLFYLLLKVIRSEGTGSTLKKLAIGIFAGFVGYLVHSAFSVAPRMMVVKLPLFTLISLTLIATKFSAPAPEFDVARDWRGRLIAIAPAAMALGLTWIIFTPWLIGQSRFVALRGERPDLGVIKQLESSVQEYPDIYALDYLSRLEINARRADQLQRTVALIDKVLPDYREVGYTKALLAILRGNLPLAQKMALEFQNGQDRYFEAPIYLLMKLSFVTNNLELFKHQFELFVRKLVFDSHLHTGIEASGVVINFDETKLPFKIESDNNTFVFDWNMNVVREIFDAGRAVRAANSYTGKEKEVMLSKIEGQLAGQPYFQLRIHPAYRQNGIGTINDKLKEYFTDLQNLQNISQRLAIQDRMELAAAAADDIPALEESQNEERARAVQALKAQMADCAAYLAARSDWTLFLQKRKFMIAFIGKIGNVIYPVEIAGKK